MSDNPQQSIVVNVNQCFKSEISELPGFGHENLPKTIAYILDIRI